MDADKAEILLRLQSGIESITSSMPAPPKSFSIIRDQRRSIVGQTIDIIEKAHNRAPDNARLLLRLAICYRENGKDISGILKTLSAIKTEEAREVYDLLVAVYEKKTMTKASALEAKEKLTKKLSPGWFQNAALYHVYKISKQHDEAKTLMEAAQESNQRLVMRFLILVPVFLISVVVGLGVILVQLFFLPRRVSTAQERAQLQAPVPYGFLTIYGVMIAWLTTQLLMGLAAQTTLKSMHLAQAGVLVAALATAGFYLLSNGPGLLYVYLLALKPHGVKFMDGVRLRFRVGRNGPFRLFLSGLFTWFAAVPLVIVCYFIASKYLGSQGSNNPVISLVMQVAGSENLAAVLVFYLTLGVMAPICEEILFRGFLYTALRRYWGVFPSILVSAGLFSAVHLDAGGFLPLFCLGALFAFVVERTRSIFPSMVAHGLWNSGTFTMVLMLFGK